MAVNVSCHICGKTFPVRPYKAKRPRQFCSRACLGKWRSQQTGENAANWRGGMAVQRGGRVKVYFPEHRDANERGYVWRSRLEAEQKLGRYLEKGEVVHHIDGDMTNDDPDNLEVFASQAEHARHHGHEVAHPFWEGRWKSTSTC